MSQERVTRVGILANHGESHYSQMQKTLNNFTIGGGPTKMYPRV